MPNELEGNVHRLVEAGPGLLTTETLLLADIRWVSPAAEKGDQVVIESAEGKIMWESMADSANYVERDYIGRVAVGGYAVPALDSGTLYLRVVRQNRELYSG